MYVDSWLDWISISKGGEETTRTRTRTIMASMCIRYTRRSLLMIWDSVFLSTVLHLILWTSLVRASADSSTTPVRRPDLLFDSSTVLHGRNVTCDNRSDSDYKFPAETWSCYNMRIDGLRLRSYYKQKSSGHCTDENYKGKSDLGALCRQLLEAHGIEAELWAAFIVKNPSCGGSSSGERMMFLKTNKSYEWVKYQAGKGYVLTLRCMLMQ